MGRERGSKMIVQQCLTSNGGASNNSRPIALEIVKASDKLKFTIG